MAHLTSDRSLQSPKYPLAAAFRCGFVAMPHKPPNRAVRSYTPPRTRRKDTKRHSLSVAANVSWTTLNQVQRPRTSRGRWSMNVIIVPPGPVRPEDKKSVGPPRHRYR